VAVLLLVDPVWGNRRGKLKFVHEFGIGVICYSYALPIERAAKAMASYGQCGAGRPASRPNEDRNAPPHSRVRAGLSSRVYSTSPVV
jgi:hypothetical protein